MEASHNLDRRLVGENPREENDRKEDHEDDSRGQRVRQEFGRLRRRAPFSFEGHLRSGGPPDLHGLTPRKSQAVRGRRGPPSSRDSTTSNRPRGTPRRSRGTPSPGNRGSRETSRTRRSS